MGSSWTVSIVAVLVVWILWLWRRLPDYKLASKLPGRRWAMPILGHTYLFFGYAQESIFGRMRSTLDTEFAQLPYSKFWCGPQLVAIVTDASCVERVIFNRTLLHKGDLLHAADRIVGNGMLFGSGADVKKRRRGILPSFKMRMLDQYLAVFYRNSRLLQQVLKKKTVEGEDFHLETLIHHCSFDAVNETTLDVRTNCLLGQNAGMVQDLIDIYGILFEDIVKPWRYHGMNVLRRLGFQLRADNICDMLDNHIGGVLKSKKTYLQNERTKNIKDSKTNGKSAYVATEQNYNIEKNGIQNGAVNIGIQNGGHKTATAENGGHKTYEVVRHETKTFQNGERDLDEDCKIGETMSTLEFMLRSEFEISDNDLIMEMKNIFMASSDTVAQICSFLFKMFAVHPEYQERAYAEVLQVLGDAPQTPTAAQVARLEYLDRCLRETVRLFPIAPFIPRKCEEPLQLDDKVTLPTGTTLLVGVFWLHRSPQHWSRPNSFYPDHFAAHAQAARHRAAFLPFSGGSHSCIGQQYAMTFMKIIAAATLLEFRVEPADSDYVSCQLEHVESAQNGVPQNGVNHNGVSQNGVNHKGVPQNGVNHNGVSQNGVNHNGVPQNGVNHNGVPQNGVNHNGVPQNGVNHNAASQNGGINSAITSSSGHNGSACQNDSQTANQDGGAVNEDNLKNNCTRRTVVSNSNGIIFNGIKNKVENKFCRRVDCKGRYIPEDYVAKMNLSTDISVRLIGGIDVKMYRRNNY